MLHLSIVTSACSQKTQTDRSCVIYCSKTHCYSDRDCDTDVGEKCYSNVPGCMLTNMPIKDGQINPIVDEEFIYEEYGERPSWVDDRNDPANFRFCGLNFTDVAEHCSMDRHCPDYICSDKELSCFEHLSIVAGAEHCNAYEIIRGNTRAPTQKPSSSQQTEVRVLLIFVIRAFLFIHVYI